MPARVVLLEPRRGANVGAVCRAIKNMGAAGLVVVGGEFDAGEAERTAVHARDVFASRRQAASLDEAVSGCSLVIGTTSRTQPWRIPVLPIRQVIREAVRLQRSAADASATRAPARPVSEHVASAPLPCALVFGREDRGLSNEELSRCHRLAYVPTAGDYASLNLAQAVVVCLYEWLQAERAGAAEERFGPAPEAAPDLPAALLDEGADADRQAAAASVSAALDDLQGALVEIGFLSAERPERVMATIASLLARSGLDEREVRVVRGIARQIRWFARGGAAVAERKRREGLKLR